VKTTEAVPTQVAIEQPPSQWRRYLGFQNISAIYIFVAIFIVFAIWTPTTLLKPAI